MQEDRHTQTPRNQSNWRIAKILGWLELSVPVEVQYFWRAGSQSTGRAGVCRPNGEPALESWIPDYGGDLNAMREAERSLNVDQQYLYGEALARECRRAENILAGDDPENEFPFNGWGHFSLSTLDATVRAGVFLRLFEASVGQSVGRTKIDLALKGSGG